jgi:hypothetical protein
VPDGMPPLHASGKFDWREYPTDDPDNTITSPKDEWTWENSDNDPFNIFFVNRLSRFTKIESVSKVFLFFIYSDTYLD